MSLHNSSELILRETRNGFSTIELVSIVMGSTKQYKSTQAETREARAMARDFCRGRAARAPEYFVYFKRKLGSDRRKAPTSGRDERAEVCAKKVKRKRAQGECLGIRSRRRT